MLARVLKTAFIAIALVGIVPSQAAALGIGPDMPVVRHMSGIEIVRRDRPLAGSEQLSGAFSDALRLADAYPDDLGYPYADRRSSTLILRSASPAGDHLLGTWSTSGMRVTLGLKEVFVEPPSVAHRVLRTTRSVRVIDQVRDLRALPTIGVRNAGLVRASEPDFEHNRVTFSVVRLDDALLFDLAAKYGAGTVAVRLDDVGQMYLNRHNNTSPFKGGAQIIGPAGACTSGFSWWNQGVANYMIIAGHCAPNGGNVITPANGGTYLGAVSPGLHENWNVGTGTVPFTYQSAYRGDLAAVTVSGSIEASIYKGLASTETTAPVKEMWYRSPDYGDEYCSGGAATGELCSYIVTGIRVNRNIDGGYLQNATEGTRSGGCTGAGDSGGPIYTVRGDGGIAAKGVESSSNRSSNCVELFTDIWEAYYGLPGVLKIQ